MLLVITCSKIQSILLLHFETLLYCVITHYSMKISSYFQPTANVTSKRRRIDGTEIKCIESEGSITTPGGAENNSKRKRNDHDKNWNDMSSTFMKIKQQVHTEISSSQKTQTYDVEIEGQKMSNCIIVIDDDKDDEQDKKDTVSKELPIMNAKIDII